MKNLHTLSTDKPSSLTIMENKLIISKFVKWESKPKDWEIGDGINQNIYITSDSEIKEGDWYCSPNGIVSKHNGTEKLPNNWNKIILTTDQDLIKDGVQKIDDEFLEWFVKNPSCEEVKVDLVPVNEFGSEITVNGYGFDKFKYKIIILKEEREQETLEEVAKKLFGGLEKGIGADRRNIWMNGAKWQQEQILQFLYSEITERRPYSSSKMCEKVIEFIEQFKKK